MAAEHFPPIDAENFEAWLAASSYFEFGYASHFDRYLSGEELSRQPYLTRAMARRNGRLDAFDAARSQILKAYAEIATRSACYLFDGDERAITGARLAAVIARWIDTSNLFHQYDLYFPEFGLRAYAAADFKDGWLLEDPAGREPLVRILADCGLHYLPQFTTKARP